MDQKTGALILALPICGLCLTTACGTATVNEKPMTCPSSISPGNVEELTHALSQVRSFLKSTAPDQFTGIVLSPSETTIEVYRIPEPESGIDGKVCKSFPQTPIRFHATRWNEGELYKTTKKIWRDHRYWKTNNVNIKASEFARDFSHIQVQTANPRRDSALLRTRYGSIVQAVKAVDQSEPAVGMPEPSPRPR